METEIQVSIKVCGPGNSKSKHIVKDNQEIYPTVQPINLHIQSKCTQVCDNVTLLDRSNISDINPYNSSPSNENKQSMVSSDDICFDKLNVKKRVKIFEYFGEDSDDIPEFKIIKPKPSIDKNNRDAQSNKDSVVKKKRRKIKHSDDIEHSSVLNTETRPATYKSKANNKKLSKKTISMKATKDGLVEKNQTKEKLSLDIKNKSNDKLLQRRRKPKSQKNNSKENKDTMKRNSPAVSNDSAHHFTDVTSPLSVVSSINNSVDQLWGNLGMVSPTERSGNILKSFPLSTSTQLPTTYTDSHCEKHDQGVIFQSADKVASQKDSNTNINTSNLNHLEDQSKIQVLTDKVVRTVEQNDMDAISDVWKIKDTCSTSFPHLEENINVSEAIKSYDKTSKNNLELETNADNVGKIRLRDPKTLMKNNENIHIEDQLNNGSSTLPVNTNNDVIIHSPNQMLSSNSLASPPPSYIFHYLPNPGYKHQSSETRQKKDCGMKERDDVGFENVQKILYSELCKWFFDEVIELKSAKMSEILHLVIADKICKDERVKRATKLMSESSIAEEKRRVDREYSDTLRIRGNEFKALFNDVVENFSFLPSKEIMIIVLYCKIINGLLKIEETNRKYCMSARILICDILKKNSYKNLLVYDLLSLSDTNFEQKYCKVQTVLSLLNTKKSEGIHSNNTKSSAKENPSYEAESQMSNACNEVSLAFNLGKKLSQLIKNKEYHISVHLQNNRSPIQIDIQQEREMACDTVRSVPENESISNELVQSSVVKHASTLNSVTHLPSFTNYNQSILPVHSVLNTTQEHQQKMMRPPPPHIMHTIQNIARVNPNIISNSRSIENRNNNCNVQEKIGQTQSNSQINYQASAPKHISQLYNQQAQNIQTSTDKSHYYRQQFSEHQKIAHMQNGYKQLSPQTGGTSIETQNNRYIPVAIQQQQNMQAQNYYRHIPLETQQPKQIHNGYRKLPHYAEQFLQPHNSFNVQQMHGSKSIENEQNIQKQTNYSHLLTQTTGVEHNNNYRPVAMPTSIDSGQASNKTQTPEQHIITSKEQNNINYQNHPVTNQSNNQSELYNYGKDNPHSISYARLRQTSAIQEHREIKRALVQPMIIKPAGQFTARVQSQKHIINLNNSMLHNGVTTLSQIQLTSMSKETRPILLNGDSVDLEQRSEIQKLVGQKSIESWEKSTNQVQSNTQNNHSNKTDFRNETQESTVSNSPRNPLKYPLTQSEFSDNVSSYVTQQNTLHTINNIMDSSLNHQNNVNNQNQQSALSSIPINPVSSPRHSQTVHSNIPRKSSQCQVLQDTSPSIAANGNTISSPRHNHLGHINVPRTSHQSQVSQNKSPQRSSSSATSSDLISSFKHGQTVNTNISGQSSLCQISQNTTSSTAASSNQVSSPIHSQTFQQNKLNQTSNQSGIIKPPLEPQSNLSKDVLESNEEYLARLLKCMAQTSQDQTRNIEFQIANEKYIAAFNQMKEQQNYLHIDPCQNKMVSNVPVQREVIQAYTSLSMNQCQTPSGRLPGTHQNLSGSPAQQQPSNQDLMPRQVPHQGSMDHSFPSQIKIQSVHSQAPSAFNKEVS